MKLSIILLGMLWLSSAVSGEWIDSYSRLKTSVPVLYICSELVLANDTPIVVDTQQCLNKGKFIVIQYPIQYVLFNMISKMGHYLLDI